MERWLMADLSTLDATKPDNAELARLGASRIRDVAVATKTSFGFEHDLTGTHRFPAGETADRPAAGKAGRIFINFERGSVERDDGVVWALLRTGGAGRNLITTPLVLTGAYQEVAVVSAQASLNAFIHTNVTVLVSYGSAQLNVGRFKFLINGADYGPEWDFNHDATDAQKTELFCPTELITTGIVEGVNNVSFQMKVTTGLVEVATRLMVTRSI